MPHSLFLGSAFATQEREKPAPPAPDSPSATKCDEPEGKDFDGTESIASLPSPEAPPRRAWYRRRWSTRGAYERAVRAAKVWFRVVRSVPAGAVEVRSHAEWENHSLAFVRTHLNHGIVDMTISLLGIAVVINALYVHPVSEALAERAQADLCCVCGAGCSSSRARRSTTASARRATPRPRRSSTRTTSSRARSAKVRLAAHTALHLTY